MLGVGLELFNAAAAQVRMWHWRFCVWLKMPGTYKSSGVSHSVFLSLRKCINLGFWRLKDKCDHSNFSLGCQGCLVAFNGFQSRVCWGLNQCASVHFWKCPKFRTRQIQNVESSMNWSLTADLRQSDSQKLSTSQKILKPSLRLPEFFANSKAKVPICPNFRFAEDEFRWSQPSLLNPEPWFPFHVCCDIQLFGSSTSSCPSVHKLVFKVRNMFVSSFLLAVPVAILRRTHISSMYSAQSTASRACKLTKAFQGIHAFPQNSSRVWSQFSLIAWIVAHVCGESLWFHEADFSSAGKLWKRLVMLTAAANSVSKINQTWNLITALNAQKIYFNGQVVLRSSWWIAWV